VSESFPAEEWLHDGMRVLVARHTWQFCRLHEIRMPHPRRHRRSQGQRLRTIAWWNRWLDKGVTVTRARSSLTVSTMTGATAGPFAAAFLHLPSTWLVLALAVIAGGLVGAIVGVLDLAYSRQRRVRRRESAQGVDRGGYCTVVPSDRGVA
jgi:hypothetical protein